MKSDKIKLITIFLLSLLVISSGCISDDGGEGFKISNAWNSIKDKISNLLGKVGLSSSSIGLDESMDITITDQGFSRNEITLKKGQNVVFENSGRNIHNLNIAGMGIDENLDNGEIISITFDEIGAFTARDQINGFSLTIQVTN